MLATKPRYSLCNVKRGEDPTVSVNPVALKVPTFAECAAKYIASHKSGERTRTVR
jgi:hypothetical protein